MIDINANLLQGFVIFFYKKTCGGTIKIGIMSSKKLGEELHKPITKTKSPFTFYKQQLGAALADMLLISKFNNEIWFLLYFIGIFS